MDSFLELMSLSGISLMSVSLCPFWLKFCGTASVVLFSMALRCSPNLSRSVRFVCPMYSAEAVGVFCISGIGLCRWGFRMHMWLLLDVMYLACAFECAWGQTVLNLAAGFTFFELHFLIVGGLVRVCAFFTFGQLMTINLYFFLQFSMFIIPLYNPLFIFILFRPHWRV